MLYLFSCFTRIMKPLLSLPHRSLRCGFTLIEMLIVITVIGILAGLLFPVFARARENARRMTCASNLRQFAFAMQQYTDDNNRRLPVGRPLPTNSNVLGRGWAGSLYPYVKSTSVFQCPSDSGLDGVRGTSSYAYNQSLLSKNDEKVRAMSLLRLNDAKRTVMLFEVSSDQVFDLNDVNENLSPSGCGLNVCISGGRYATGYIGGVRQGEEVYMSPLGRHGEKAMYLFADGHVQWLSGERISPGYPAYSPRDKQILDGSPYTAAGTRFKGFDATFSPV